MTRTPANLNIPADVERYLINEARLHRLQGCPIDYEQRIRFAAAQHYPREARTVLSALKGGERGGKLVAAFVGIGLVVGLAVFA